MIYDISKYPKFKVIDFDLKKQLKNVRLIDSELLTIEIYDPKTEEIVTEKLNLCGVDESEQIFYIKFLNNKKEQND